MSNNIASLISSKQDSKLPQCILEPYVYLESIPSNNKNVRSTFLRAFNELYYHIDDAELLKKIEEVIAIFHNASLLIDDIEDNSSYRRGLPTAHTQFGVPLTINSGNLMYFVALERAMKLAEFRLDEHQGRLAVMISEILTEEMLNLHHGQGLDIYWRDNKASISNPPTVDEYLQMIMNKTGGLFRLSVRLLECFTSEKEMEGKTNVPLANLLGIIYQIRDDYLNLVDPNYSHMKGFTGEDLIEGKLSLPILHSLLTSNDSTDSVNYDACSPVKSVLMMKDRDSLKANQTLIAESIEYMKSKTNSLTYSHSLLKEYQVMAKEMIGAENCLLLQVLNQLCDI
ncbi:geranylgeranyl pyrophosphate synthase [[Candida] railenensis]|uniref:Geranylgeranyl pyrophosphate synthase n=1 Tax=[Candida] railenensis TaxID=45579 RepID=A0A9P0QVF4_9ASCO|nr:geranylgeranyl pyrophosphate synthase [[Candida] railenensis]